jgi:hypothetical protein
MQARIFESDNERGSVGRAARMLAFRTIPDSVGPTSPVGIQLQRVQGERPTRDW